MGKADDYEKFKMDRLNASSGYMMGRENEAMEQKLTNLTILHQRSMMFANATSAEVTRLQDGQITMYDMLKQLAEDQADSKDEAAATKGLLRFVRTMIEAYRPAGFKYDENGKLPKEPFRIMFNINMPKIAKELNNLAMPALWRMVELYTSCDAQSKAKLSYMYDHSEAGAAYLARFQQLVYHAAMKLAVDTPGGETYNHKKYVEGIADCFLPVRIPQNAKVYTTLEEVFNTTYPSWIHALDNTTRTRRDLTDPIPFAIAEPDDFDDIVLTDEEMHNPKVIDMINEGQSKFITEEEMTQYFDFIKEVNNVDEVHEITNVNEVRDVNKINEFVYIDTSEMVAASMILFAFLIVVILSCGIWRITKTKRQQKKELERLRQAHLMVPLTPIIKRQPVLNHRPSAQPLLDYYYASQYETEV